MVDATRPPGGELVIRGLRPDDAEGLLDVYSQPGVIRGTLQLPFPALEIWRQRAAAGGDGHHVLVATLDGRVIGNLGLHVAQNPRRRHTGAIGMAVHDDHQGRGVGRALMHAALELADAWLDLRRLELEVFVDNEPGVRLYRGCGFEVEGTRRAYALRDGVLADVYSMARLRQPAP